MSETERQREPLWRLPFRDWVGSDQKVGRVLSALGPEEVADRNESGLGIGGEQSAKEVTEDQGMLGKEPTNIPRNLIGCLSMFTSFVSGFFLKAFYDILPNGWHRLQYDR